MSHISNMLKLSCMYTHIHNNIDYSQQSVLSSSTRYCVSLPVSADGSSFFVRICRVGDDLCVILLGAIMAETGSENKPLLPLLPPDFLSPDLETSDGTS